MFLPVVANSRGPVQSQVGSLHDLAMAWLSLLCRHSCLSAGCSHSWNFTGATTLGSGVQPDGQIHAGKQAFLAQQALVLCAGHAAFVKHSKPLPVREEGVLGHGRTCAHACTCGPLQPHAISATTCTSRQPQSP